MSFFNRTTQLRMRRIVRRRQKQMEEAAESAEKQFERNFIGRFDRLFHVKRFVIGWFALIVIVTFGVVMQTIALGGYYQRVQPVPGGIYNEGIVGTYSNANPIFATGSVDAAVSKLLFAGLLTYDSHDRLASDLASSYTVDSSGKHYTVHLRKGLTWQDGHSLTAADVVFTYQLIQNPDAESPLQPAWQNIVVAAPDDYTVTFDLPNVFAAFPYNLTTGILPKHILASVPVSQLRSNVFNTTQPVGAGPFTWQAIQISPTTDPDKAVSLIALKAFQGYAGGTPKLAGFVIHAFGSKAEMVRAFKARDINAIAGLNSVPKELAGAKDITATDFPSTASMMAFFKTSSGVLADTQVRQALVKATDVNAIVHELGYPAKPVKEPLLMGQLGYDPKYNQAAFNPTEAKAILDKAGWTVGSHGVRSKDGNTLTFRLYAEDDAESSQVAQALVQGWQAIGIDAVAVMQPLTDFQTTLQFHTYDALLYGISIGVDPDVFAYWDSSQADIRSNSRLNFSEYKSTAADASLEAGRTRIASDLRVIKYRPFLQAWQNDAPAIGLYQPRFLYITRGTVYGLTEHTLNVDTDRYDSVANWEIRTAKVTR